MKITNLHRPHSRNFFLFYFFRFCTSNKRNSSLSINILCCDPDFRSLSYPVILQFFPPGCSLVLVCVCACALSQSLVHMSLPLPLLFSFFLSPFRFPLIAAKVLNFSFRRYLVDFFASMGQTASSSNPQIQSSYAEERLSGDSFVLSSHHVNPPSPDPGEDGERLQHCVLPRMYQIPDAEGECSCAFSTHKSLSLPSDPFQVSMDPAKQRIVQFAISEADAKCDPPLTNPCATVEDVDSQVMTQLRHDLTLDPCPGNENSNRSSMLLPTGLSSAFSSSRSTIASLTSGDSTARFSIATVGSVPVLASLEDSGLLSPEGDRDDVISFSRYPSPAYREQARPGNTGDLSEDTSPALVKRLALEQYLRSPRSFPYHSNDTDVCLHFHFFPLLPPLPSFCKHFSHS